MTERTQLSEAVSSVGGTGWKRRLGRLSLRLVRLALVIYLGLILVLSLLQTRMIFPGAATQGLPEASFRPRPGTELLTLKTAQGDQVAALFAPALSADGQPLADAARRPTLLFFYGNGMCLRDTVELVERFRRLGANVLAPEYVGYGLSTGEPGEAGCYATADAAYDHLLTRRDIDPKRIIASGWSLGGAVAIDLASRKPVAGLAVFSTFTSMTDLGQTIMPWAPVGLLLKHRFESLKKLPSIGVPIVIGHGRQDSIVPQAMSEALAAAATAPVTRFTVGSADHNDFFDYGERPVAEHLGKLVEQVAR
ncbi:MAG: alpha/beta hydrolase [Isosphaeraceae bacterium]